MFPEKALCLINFETNPNVLGQLLKDSNVLNLTNFIKYKYALFIQKSLRRKNIPKFNEVYTFLMKIMSVTKGDQQIRC